MSCPRCNDTKINPRTGTACRACSAAPTAAAPIITEADPVAAFAASHPAEYKWLVDNQRNNFAASLMSALEKWGRLSEKQIGAVTKIVARDAAKPVKIDLSAVLEKFANAQAAGLKRPKLRLEGLCISLAGGNNAGWLYVKNGPAWEDTYLGKVNPQTGEFFRSRDCSDADIERLLNVADDVLAAAVAYGQETGQCSACGRELTNPESIAAAIGPICADRFGF